MAILHGSHNMSLTNRNVVKQSYELNNARYSLTAVETDIIMRMIAEVKNEDEDFKPYRFKVSELEKKMGKQLDRRSLKKIALELRRKNLTIDKGKEGFLITGWVSSFEYIAKSGEMELCFDPKLKPYLLQLQSHFAMADIRQIFQLSSEYAKRIYTIFKQWEKLGKYTVEVVEWQKIFEVPKTQLMYGEFKRKVIDVAVKQINENTELEVSYKEIKTGRKITHLEWTIKKCIGQQMTIGDFSKDEIDTREINFLNHIDQKLKSFKGMPKKEQEKAIRKLCEYHLGEFREGLIKEALIKVV